MLESFILVLTLCGTLNSGHVSCEDFVLDTEQTEISCLRQIETVYNQEKTKLYEFMGEAGNDWFKTTDPVEKVRLTKAQIQK